MAKEQNILSRPRTGFTFLEVLFSCALLGIGFIMVAAVFPVAIRETQAASDETIGMAINRDAERYLQAQLYGNIYTTTVNGSFFPAADVGTGRVYAFNPVNYLDGAQRLQGIGNQICTFDSRYGWVGFWRRDKDPSGNPLPYAQIWTIAVRSASSNGYSSTNPPDLIWFPQPPLSALNTRGGIDGMQSQPLLTATFFYNGATQPATVQFPNLASPDTSPPPAVGLGPDVDGAFVIVAAVPTANLQSMVGRIYRLGANVTQRGAADTWTLQPGMDVTLADMNLGIPNGGTLAAAGVSVFIVGRQLINIGTANNPVWVFSGPAQDLACHSSIVQVNF